MTIYLLYGQPASGKTTLSKLLCKHIEHKVGGCDPAIIDGDEFRELLANKDYSKKGRYQNIRNANAIATYINNVEHRDVIMALVNPYKCLRAELKINNSQVREIMLTSNRALKKEYHVKDFEMGNPDYIIDTDQKIEDSWNQLKGLLKI